jgi:hypothetical protein
MEYLGVLLAQSWALQDTTELDIILQRRIDDAAQIRKLCKDLKRLGATKAIREQLPDDKKGRVQDLLREIKRLRNRWALTTERKESRLAVLCCHVCLTFFFGAASHVTLHDCIVPMSVLRNVPAAVLVYFRSTLADLYDDPHLRAQIQNARHATEPGAAHRMI